MTAPAPRILILGNLGYIGPVLAAHLRTSLPGAVLTGFDTAYFQGCLLDPYAHAEHGIHHQYFGDIRRIDASLFAGIDAVVALAAISNDPMGNLYEKPTMQINADAIANAARLAKAAGVKRFVFASSCSVYGAGGDTPKDERAEVNPLTAYARSKIACEQALQPLADASFTITCLRFATACGASPRLRLDLVLNDFVASALVTKAITILSDGTPWRPLINVADMSRAIEWAITRDLQAGGHFLTVNTGSDAWNYTIRELAEAVAAHIGGVSVSVNPDAPPDKRSYRVDFSLYRSLAPKHQPLKTLEATIAELTAGFASARFADAEFRTSHLIRLNTLNTLKARALINDDLYWLDAAA